MPGESSYNDSYEYEPHTREQFIAHGVKLGATHTLICTDHDGSLEAEYVMVGQCVGTIEKCCWRSSFSVECIDL